MSSLKRCIPIKQVFANVKTAICRSRRFTTTPVLATVQRLNTGRVFCYTCSGIQVLRGLDSLALVVIRSRIASMAVADAKLYQKLKHIEQGEYFSPVHSFMEVTNAHLTSKYTPQE